MGTFTVNGRAAEAGIDRVDAALRDIMRKTAERSPYDVEVFSGKRGGGGKSRHDTGKAVDVVLRDPRTGQAIANLGSKPGFDAYQGFANTAKQIQEKDYPNLSNQFRWGGYFSPSGLNPKGFDLMHFDLKPGASMAYGTWDGGLNADGAAAYAKLGEGMIYSADGRVLAPKGVQYANLWSDPTYAASQARVPPASIPDVSFASTYGTLRLKKNPKVDERVRFLQQTLNDQFGFDLEADGRFGPATDAAVRAFQKTMGLDNIDGVAGKDTWGAIERVARPPTDMSLEARDARALARAIPGVTGNAISTRSQLPSARPASPPQPERPSPFDALSDVVTRPPQVQRPSLRDLDQVRLNANLGRELDVLSSVSTRPGAGPTPDQRAAATQELRDNLPRPIDAVRPKPNPLGPRPPTAAEAARFSPGNRVFDSTAPRGDLPGVDSLRTGAAASARPVTESPLESFTRGWNNYAPAEKRPSPFDALSKVRTVTAPLPRPRPTVAARPSALPTEKPPPSDPYADFETRRATALSSLPVRPTATAVPIPRPSPVPATNAAAASARAVPLPRPRPTPSRGTPTRSTAPSRPSTRVSANTRSPRKSALSRAGSD